MILSPLIIAALSLVADQRMVAPPVVRPSTEMTAALGQKGFAPAPENIVALAASCRASGNYFLAAGAGRILSVADGLDRCWRKRTASTLDGITIRRWSQPQDTNREAKGASTLRAVVITNDAFTLLTFGADLGKGD